MWPAECLLGHVRLPFSDGACGEGAHARPQQCASWQVLGGVHLLFLHISWSWVLLQHAHAAQAVAQWLLSSHVVKFDPRRPETKYTNHQETTKRV